MAKEFVFKTPEQLKEITGLCKDNPSQIMNTAKVWSVVTRQKEKTPWDGRICVSFFSQGPERKACVFRYGTKNQRHILGWLKYNAALKWCSEHLQPAQ